ncbi:MAG: DUF421 domain-containing protein [Pyrinomonadaceae bacterium]
MFFNDWYGLERILIVGFLAYVALIICLRISGKRTLAKWNAFDFVVTIALGSILATQILSRNTPLVEGILAFSFLIVLQFLITKISVYSKFIRDTVKAEPTLLLRKGKFIDKELKRQRVTESEIRAAVRSQGFAALEDAEAVVLETDGSFSVIKKSETESFSALQDVENFG